MITDKLLAFADKKAITATADSDVVDLGSGGDEIARTLNLVVQVERASEATAVTPNAASVTVALKRSEDGTTWETVQTFPAVTVEKIEAGARVVNFAKLPLGAFGPQLKLTMTVASGPLVGAVYSAWLTDSAESA